MTSTAVRRRVIVATVGAAVVVAGALLLATPGVASSTAGAPSGRATKPERVARRFLVAYDAYDGYGAL